MSETRTAPLERRVAAEEIARPSVSGRRWPLALAAVLLAVALAIGGFIYWDYASRFESTDDAFIDARQHSLFAESCWLRHRRRGD